MGLVEPEHRDAVLQEVVRDVRNRGNAVSAGDVGYGYLLRALAEGGRSDVIFDMTNQVDQPGYGYQLKMGATSLTESWVADPMSSQDHFMLGQIIEWFYADLAGIKCDPAGPGFKKIVIKPQPVGDLTWARASLDSIRGQIVSSWTRDKEVFTLSITIPPNTNAEVIVPTSAGRAVKVNGRMTLSLGVKFVRREETAIVYRIDSGHWVFQSHV
jgi:hypothetical protein